MKKMIADVPMFVKFERSTGGKIAIVFVGVPILYILLRLGLKKMINKLRKLRGTPKGIN